MWLQYIAELNESFNYSKYIEIEKILNNRGINLYDIFSYEIVDIIESIGIDKNIINLFKDKIIKENVSKIYDYLFENNMAFYTLEDYKSVLFKRNISVNIPFCIIYSDNIDLNLKNVYLYYNDYFSKCANSTIKYISKIINQNGGNAISLYNCENTIRIYNDEIEKIANNINKEKMFERVIILNKKYMAFFIMLFLDFLVIAEGKYEIELKQLVDLFMESGKEIYVVPSYIFNKNSYFSNYLIKQGSEIILGANDVKLMLKDNSR